VAGSPAGLKRTAESMLPSILKCSKPIYLYDEINKQLIFKTDSKVDMGKAVGVSSASNLSFYKTRENLYLNRFIFSSTLLDSNEYTTNLMSKENLLTYLNEIRIV
jgi:hypothetical protein